MPNVYCGSNAVDFGLWLKPQGVLNTNLWNACLKAYTNNNAVSAKHTRPTETPVLIVTTHTAAAAVAQELEEYEFCTFFTKKEILHVHNRFKQLKEVGCRIALFCLSLYSCPLRPRHAQQRCTAAHLRPYSLP